jgi:predicted esterase
MANEARRARRSARAMAAACTAAGLAAMFLAPAARPAAAAPEVRAWVEVEAHGLQGGTLVYPPVRAADAPWPVTVVLHGLGGEPQSVCAPFVDLATSRGWLVCPRGEDPYGAGARWRVRGDDDARLVEASVRALEQEHPWAVDASAGRLLVGFSLGGIAAVRIVQASPRGTYMGLVVIDSQVRPDASALRRAGVQRVVLAAGDLDLTSAPLRQSANELAAHGVETRFVSLGRVGHGYPADMQERMREPMQWVAAGVARGGGA